MKALQILIPSILILFTFLSCEKNDHNPALEDFCNVKPVGWDCEIIESDFSLNDIPRNADDPVAIIKYKNVNIEFIVYTDIVVNPSLILDFYPIDQKEKLIDFIKSQQVYSWCIPIYYGETNDFFIITSPCFINGGSFTEEANSSISDLQNSIKSLIIINDYGLIEK